MNNQTILHENSFDESWNESDNSPPLHTRLTFASTWIIIAVAGILGNGLVIYIAIRFQKMSNVTNCFIVNLAITDIVFLAFCMPLLVVQYTLEKWFFNQLFCKLLNFISFISVLVTVLTLVVMTIDRYIYVVRPFDNLKWRKPRTVLLLSIIIWIISCILASPYYHHYGVTIYRDSHPQCALLSDDEQIQKYFRIYTVTLYYFIPLTIIIMSYTHLLYYIYSKENKLKTNTENHVVRRSKKRRAVTKMVAIVTFAFAICWLPITLYIMFGNFFEKKTALLYYYKILAHSFAYFNSAINPLLYAFLNRSFRTNCGSLIFEPTCTIFCGDESFHRTRSHHQQQRRQRQQPPSTQIDRFSYQSTNCQTVSTNQEKQIQLISNSPSKNQLTVDLPLHLDFSDGEYDVSEAECPSQIPMENTNAFRYQQISSANTLTTTF